MKKETYNNSCVFFKVRHLKNETIYKCFNYAFITSNVDSARCFCECCAFNPKVQQLNKTLRDKRKNK